MSSSGSLQQSSEDILSASKNSSTNLTVIAKMESETKMQGVHESGNESSLTRDSCTGVMDFVVIKNDKVRYYYNKTLSLRAPIQNMVESLGKVHREAFAYLSQLPSSGDYSVISTLLELIPTISATIDWESMNHACYWDDFCRETKQLIMLVEKVNGAALKSCDTAGNVLNLAQELFEGIVQNNRDLHETTIEFPQSSDYFNEEPCSQNIQIQWSKSGNKIELAWHDADGGLMKVFLNHTGTGFRLRFLRHIIYRARTCLELVYLTFMKLSVKLCLDIPLAKLEKCQNVQLKKLTPKEHAFLSKAKREFDAGLEVIWKMVSRFKLQTFQLLRYKTMFKGLRKSWSHTIKAVPAFEAITITVDDSLFMRVISFGIQAQAKEESFDFTVFPDRTEDIMSKIEDMLVVDYTDYKELLMLSNILQLILPQEKQNFTQKELTSVTDEIKLILEHRFHIRRYIKQAIGLLEKHSAFQKLKTDIVTHVKSSPEKGQSNTYLGESTDASDSCLDEDRSTIANNNPKAFGSDEDQIWITVEGEIMVTLEDPKGVVAQFPDMKTIKPYQDLNLDERVIINVRLVRKMLSFVAHQQCWLKILLGRIIETKSLMKRLKNKDRLNADLKAIILEECKYIRHMSQLTKSMRHLKAHV